MMRSFFTRISLLLCFFSALSCSFAQQIPPTRPKIKNFGSSLKKMPGEDQIRAKKESGTADEDTIVVETNLVVTDVAVLDPKGNVVLGLEKDDFEVTENNQPQEIQTFGLGSDSRIPRSIVLIIDYSPSQLPYIEKSIEAAKVLVDKLLPADMMAIVTDDVELIQGFTTDRMLLKTKLDSLKKKALSKSFGKSKQFSALYAVVNELFDPEDVRRIIIFQTDGDQLRWLKNGSGQQMLDLPNRVPPTTFSYVDLLKSIEHSRVTIYTIVPGISGFNPPDSEVTKGFSVIKYDASLSSGQFPSMPFSDLNTFRDVRETLEKMSKFTGGWIEYLERPDQASGIYSRILTSINTRYIIGYTPANDVKDGKRRNVKIVVKDHPEFTVWGRKTYIAPLAN